MGASSKATAGQREFVPSRIALAVLLGTGLFVLSGALPYDADVQPYSAQMTAAITGVVATLWLSNGIHLAAASLMPLALFPLLGVVPISTAAAAYAHPILWLFFGGFVLALGVERWGLHRRIALWLIGLAGVQPSRLVLGFMLACAFLSMWLNNTATVLLLMPIALALVDSLESAGGISRKGKVNFAFALLVGIAYAGSIGGMGTPIGTAPNALFLSNYAPFVEAGAPPVSFLQWMGFALPLVAVMLPLLWILLTRILAPVEAGVPAAKAILAEQAAQLPKMDSAERRMLVLFALAALLWSTRQDIGLGALGTVPGWWRLLPVDSAQAVGDGAVAVLIATLAFCIPSGRQAGQALMNWKVARTMPWEVLLLIGGGIAIADAFTETGLAAAIGLVMQPLVGALPLTLVVLFVCVVMTFMTEVTSNTAMTALFLPVLASSAVALQLDPRILTLPATLSASCAFMLPIATPPNAIVFATGHVPMLRMARTGLLLNFVGVGLITASMWLWGLPILGVDLQGTPDWVQALGATSP